MVARDLELIELHQNIINLLQKSDIYSLNETAHLYRPHLTLARITKPTLNDFNEQVLESAPFILAVGQGDINGEFLKVIYKK